MSAPFFNGLLGRVGLECREQAVSPVAAGVVSERSSGR
jgi:hypothetical protein